MSYSFDGVNKVISISSQTTMSVRDIWSRYLEWVATSDNSKYLPAFRTVGGDVIDGAEGTSIPIYQYLINGWKIKPMEANHTLKINDGVLLVDGGGDPFVNTSGSFVVRINYSQPVQAITVANGGGGGASAEDVATAVWDRDLSTHTTSGSAGKSISDILKKVKLVLNILFFK